MPDFKCVLVGNSTAGLSALCISYVTKVLQTQSVPSVFDNYIAPVQSGGEEYSLALFDTAQQEQYDRMRPLTYPKTDVFLVCFSVVSPSSCDDVVEKWIPEITHHCPGTPFVLVGTQVHLREDMTTREELAKNREEPIDVELGRKVARQIKAAKYIECSAETVKGVKNVFEEAVLAVLEQQEQSKKKKCVIM